MAGVSIPQRWSLPSPMPGMRLFTVSSGAKRVSGGMGRADHHSLRLFPIPVFMMSTFGRGNGRTPRAAEGRTLEHEYEGSGSGDLTSL